MSSYPEPDNQIKDKVKVILDLSNYATKKLEDATSTDAPNLAAKKNCCFES